jgi:hypothetical protein
LRFRIGPWYLGIFRPSHWQGHVKGIHPSGLARRGHRVFVTRFRR